MFESESEAEVHSGDICILLCAEANQMDPQSQLLCESIRRFCGKHAGAEIVAVSPRPDLALSEISQSRLREMGVEYVVEDLNRTGSTYGAINRVVASAWVEQNSSRKYILALDSDMVFIDEPRFMNADVGVRPVDVKGATSSGNNDPQDKYWSEMCDIAGIDLDRLPIITTSIDRQRIRAAYNGGFCIAKKDVGIFQKTQSVLFDAFRKDLRPFGGHGLNITASTGPVGIVASEFWTSAQAAMSVSIWSLTDDVHVYDERYNVPLNCLSVMDATWSDDPSFLPILLHYHHLLEATSSPNILRDVLKAVKTPTARIDWIESGRDLFEEISTRSGSSA